VTTSPRKGEYSPVVSPLKDIRNFGSMVNEVEAFHLIKKDRGKSVCSYISERLHKRRKVKERSTKTGKEEKITLVRATESRSPQSEDYSS